MQFSCGFHLLWVGGGQGGESFRTPLAIRNGTCTLRILFLLIISVLSINPSHAGQGGSDIGNPPCKQAKLDLEKELWDEFEQTGALFAENYLILEDNATKEDVLNYVVEDLPKHFSAIAHAGSFPFTSKHKNEEVIKRVMNRGEAWLDWESKALSCFQDAVDNNFCGLSNRWRVLYDECKNLMKEEDLDETLFLPWLSEMISYADFRAGDKPLGDILEAMKIRFPYYENSAFVRYFFCHILKEDMKYDDFIRKFHEVLGDDAFVYEMAIKYSFVHQLSAQETGKLRDYADNHKKHQLAPQSVLKAAVLLATIERTHPTDWGTWKTGFERGKGLDFPEQTDFYNRIPIYSTRLFEYYKSADTVSRFIDFCKDFGPCLR